MWVLEGIFTAATLLMCFTSHTTVTVADNADDAAVPDCNNRPKTGSSISGGCISQTVPPRETTPLCSHPALHGISVMDDFPTPEYFYDWFALPGQPVLFKSVLEKTDYPAYTKWTDDYLRKTFGTSKVTVESAKKETRWDNNVSQRTLAEFIRDYQQHDLYMVQNVKDKMKDDVAVPKCLLCGGPQRRLERHIMWFSGGGTRSVLHADTYHNINCLLDGTKRIIFIDKKHTERVESEGFDSDKGASRVNVDDVDYSKFPQFLNIPWLNATMEKGDCLFIPRGWYHQVNSLGSRNLAVNIWWDHVPWFNRTDCILATGVHRPTMLSSYPRAKFEDRVRVNLFTPFIDMYEVRRDAFVEIYFFNTDDDAKEPTSEREQQRIAQRIEQMFRLMDMDNNKVLSWAEIMTFNITSLLVNYGDMLPFDPADVHNEDAFLESDVLDELTNGLTDGPTEETKSSPQNKVSEEAATPHDEF